MIGSTKNKHGNVAKYDQNKRQNALAKVYDAMNSTTKVKSHNPVERTIVTIDDFERMLSEYVHEKRNVKGINNNITNSTATKIDNTINLEQDQNNQILSSIALSSWCGSNYVDGVEHLDTMERESDESDESDESQASYDSQYIKFDENIYLIERYFRSWRKFSMKHYHYNVRMNNIDTWNKYYGLQLSINKWSRFTSKIQRLKNVNDLKEKIVKKNLLNVFTLWRQNALNSREVKRTFFQFWKQLISCKNWLIKFYIEKLRDLFIRLKRRCKFEKILPFCNLNSKRRCLSIFYTNSKRQELLRRLIEEKSLPYMKLRYANILFQNLYDLKTKKKTIDLANYFVLAKYFKQLTTNIHKIWVSKELRNRFRHCVVNSLRELRAQSYFKLKANVKINTIKQMKYSRARLHLLSCSKTYSLNEIFVRNSSSNHLYDSYLSSSSSFILKDEKNRNTSRPELITKFAKWKCLFKNKSVMHLSVTHFEIRKKSRCFNYWRQSFSYRESNKISNRFHTEKLLSHYFNKWSSYHSRKQIDSRDYVQFSKNWKFRIFQVLKITHMRNNMFRDDLFKSTLFFERNSLNRALKNWKHFRESNKKFAKFVKLSKLVNMARALNTFKLMSLLHLKQSIDSKRSEMRAYYRSLKKAFDKLFRFAVKRSMRRRFYFVFRAMYPIPKCSPARRIFDAWKSQFIPWSLNLKSSFRKVARLVRLNATKKFLKHWENLYDYKCQALIYKERAIGKFKQLLSRIKLSWTLTKHSVIYSKVKFPSHFHNSDMYCRNAMYSKLISNRKSLFFFLKDNLSHSKFILPGPFYRICFIKRFFVFWHRYTIASRNYYYEHRKINRKIGKTIQRYFYMRHAAITKLKKSLLSRLFNTWKDKRENTRMLIDDIVYTSRLKRSFNAWSFAYNQLYLSRNLFSSPQAIKIRHITNGANNRDRRSSPCGNENVSNYSNIFSNKYCDYIEGSTVSQNHLFQDKFLSVRSISAKRDSKDRSRQSATPTDKSKDSYSKVIVNRASSPQIFLNTSIRSSIKGRASFSPSIIHEKSEFYFQNSETLLLSPYNTPAKQSWKSQPS